MEPTEKKQKVNKFRKLQTCLKFQTTVEGITKTLEYYGFDYFSRKACRKCGMVKHKQFKIVHADRIIYVDENNLEWRYNRCPQCIREHSKKKTHVKGRILFHRKRKCTVCKGPLQLTRWKECLGCKPTLRNDVLEEYIYFDGALPSELELIPMFGAWR